MNVLSKHAQFNKKERTDRKQHQLLFFEFHFAILPLFIGRKS